MAGPVKSVPQTADEGPYIPASTRLPEITVKGVVLGLVLAVLLGAANTYLGLKVGLTVAASIPAAVMSLAVLRLFRNSNILENNMVQTIASAGTSVASGAIFTIPALILLGYWDSFHYWETTFIVVVGGLLGVLFSVPIRRALIVDEHLPFPEGYATGEVLKAGEKGGSGVGALLLGGGLGALYKVLQGGFRMWKEDPTAAFRLGSGNGVFGVGFNLQPALMGVGLIIGLRIAVLVFLGGVLGWFIGIPLYTLLGGDVHTLFETLRNNLIGSGTPVADADALAYDNFPAYVWSKRIRYIGVGAMLVGGVWSLIKLRKPLTRAIRQGIESARRKAGAVTLRTERDMPFAIVGLGAILLAVPTSIFYANVTGNAGVGIALGVVMLVTGFLFSAVGGYMAGLVGSSNTPISGVTILSLLAACLALLAFGVTGSAAPAAAVLVAAVIAVAGSIASDNLQDLKAGHMLGATPWKQQAMLIVGGVASAFFLAPVMQLLIDSEGGITHIAAPQANLMASLSTAVFSPDGFAPGQQWMILAGALLAVGLIVTDLLLKRAGSTFSTPVMPVAVGIYLPVGTSVPIFVGGLAAWAVERWYHRASRRDAKGMAGMAAVGERTGVLFASGLIAGEAILGIATSFLAAQDVTLGFDAGERHAWAGLLLLGYLVFLGYYVAIRPGLAKLGRLGKSQD